MVEQVEQKILDNKNIYKKRIDVNTIQ